MEDKVKTGAWNVCYSIGSVGDHSLLDSMHELTCSAGSLLQRKSHETSIITVFLASISIQFDDERGHYLSVAAWPVLAIYASIIWMNFLSY